MLVEYPDVTNFMIFRNRHLSLGPVHLLQALRKAGLQSEAQAS